MQLQHLFSIFCVFHSLCRRSVAAGTCAVARDEDTGTSVNCSHSELTSFPSLHFSNITVLDVSFNNLYVILNRSLSDEGWSHLRHLDVSHNSVHQLDVRAMWGLHELQTLDLSHNQLSVLSNQTLVKLSLLKTLKLDHNQLSSLGPSVFRGLSNLLHLDLSHNKLHLTSSVFPARVFRSLGQLQILHLENNDNSWQGQYPDEVFADLVSLRYLAIDTFREALFGPDFAALRNIQTLDLGYNCQIAQLTNGSLHGFKNSTLSVLKFYRCPLLKVDACAFCDIPSLTRLWIQKAYWLRPNKLIESFHGLQNQTMLEIKIHEVGSRDQFLHVIDKPSGRYLRNICVKNLSLVECNLQRIAGGALFVKGTPLLSCLERIDVSRNHLMGDVSAFMALLTSNGPLRTLALQGQRKYDVMHGACLVSQDFHCKDAKGRNYPSHTEVSFLVPTPPQITYLNMSSVLPHLRNVPNNVTFPSATHLKTLDLSNIGMSNCYATWYGLENLETFNLDGNYCSNMSDKAFDFLNNLKKLGMANVGIKPDFFMSRGERLFQNLDQLDSLDLSRNKLQSADPEMLRAQRRLKELDFSENRLQAVPVNLRNHVELSSLDLSGNMLSDLTSPERAALDTLTHRHMFSLKLYGNPLTCTCANLDMVRWLWTTSVTLDGEGRAGNYTCSTETGKITSTERVMRHWMGHWRKCVGVSVFGYALAAFLIQILAIVVTFFVSRSWTQLCYAFRAYQGFHQPQRHEFRKDAFLVYADTDRDVTLACRKLRRVLEERHGVRLLLPTRDDGAYGRVRAENIARQVDDSWKVVLLVTEDFSRDAWACGFSVQQAQRAISDVMPDRVIVIFVDSHRRLQKMPSLDVLLRVVPETNVLSVPRNTPYNHPVWERLAHLITGQP